MLLRVQMESSREVKDLSEWVVKVTDKWGQRERGCYLVGEKKGRHSGWWGDRHVVAKRKRMLFSRREEKQTQWVVEVIDKWGTKRKRILFNRWEEEQTQWVVGMIVWWQRERECYSVLKSTDMIILRRSAQPKESESINQIFNHLHLQRMFFK